MGTNFKIVATAAIFLLGSVGAANAEEYDGAGFTGTAWFGEPGEKTTKRGRVYVGEAGYLLDIKVEGQEISTLAKWDSEKIYNIMHGSKSYMEIPRGPNWAPLEFRPCADYKHGKKEGVEAVNGRNAEKWRCTDQETVRQGETPSDETVWFDWELKFPIKTVTDMGEIFEIRDIQVGPQDASIFEFPHGYKEFEMNEMMQLLMQQGRQQ